MTHVVSVLIQPLSLGGPPRAHRMAAFAFVMCVHSFLVILQMRSRRWLSFRRIGGAHLKGEIRKRGKTLFSDILGFIVKVLNVPNLKNIFVTISAEHPGQN